MLKQYTVSAVKLILFPFVTRLNYSADSISLLICDSALKWAHRCTSNRIPHTTPARREEEARKEELPPSAQQRNLIHPLIWASIALRNLCLVCTAASALIVDGKAFDVETHADINKKLWWCQIVQSRTKVSRTTVQISFLSLPSKVTQLRAHNTTVILKLH